MSTAYNVARFLEIHGFGIFAADSGWSINVGAEPELPHNCITLYDTGGLSPDTDQLDTRPMFQIRVRALSYAEGYTKLKAARSLLQVTGPVTLGGTRYMSFEMFGNIVSLGRDENDRHVFTLNVLVPNASVAI